MNPSYFVTISKNTFLSDLFAVGSHFILGYQPLDTPKSPPDPSEARVFYGSDHTSHLD